MGRSKIFWFILSSGLLTLLLGLEFGYRWRVGHRLEGIKQEIRAVHPDASPVHENHLRFGYETEGLKTSFFGDLYEAALHVCGPPLAFRGRVLEECGSPAWTAYHFTHAYNFADLAIVEDGPPMHRVTFIWSPRRLKWVLWLGSDSCRVPACPGYRPVRA